MKEERMKKLLHRIWDGVEWVLLAKWYRGGDLGDGMLVSILSLLFWGCMLGLALFALIANLFDLWEKL